MLQSAAARTASVTPSCCCPSDCCPSLRSHLAGLQLPASPHSTAVRADLGTLCPCDQSLAHVAHGKHGGGLDVIPVLLAEGVDNLLLASLLSLADTLVLTCSTQRACRIVELLSRAIDRCMPRMLVR